MWINNPTKKIVFELLVLFFFLLLVQLDFHIFNVKPSVDTKEAYCNYVQTVLK